VIIYYTLSGSGRHEDSHELLRKAIAEYTGDREKAGAFVSGMKTGENGKPYIDGFEHFSISHSGKAWAVLFDENECGLDIQYVKGRDVLSLARRWYNPIDADAVVSASEPGEAEGRAEFFRLWTRREALIKAIGSSVADTTLPSVGEDEVIVDGREYVIKTISLADDKELHAAICIRKEEYKDCDGGSGCLSGEPDAHRL
jgi:4'-phosphopantetheinyl transferase